MFGVLVLSTVAVHGNPQFQAGLQAMQEHADARVAYAGRMTEQLVYHPRRLQQQECDCPGAQAFEDATKGMQAELEKMMEEDPMAAVVASQRLVCEYRDVYECMAPCMPTEEEEGAAAMSLDCTCSPCGDAILDATAALMGAFMLMAAPPEAQAKFMEQVAVTVCSPTMLLLAECMQCAECKDAMSTGGNGTVNMGLPADQEECMCGSCRRATIGASVATTPAGKDHEACLNTTILHCYGSSSSCDAMNMTMTAEMQGSVDAMCSAADAEAALKAVVDPLIVEFDADYAYPPANRGKMCALTTAAKTSTTTPRTTDSVSSAILMSVTPVLAAFFVW